MQNWVKISAAVKNGSLAVKNWPSATFFKVKTMTHKTITQTQNQCVGTPIGIPSVLCGIPLHETSTKSTVTHIISTMSNCAVTLRQTLKRFKDSHIDMSHWQIQFLSFSCSIRQTSCQIIDFRPKLRGWQSPPPSFFVWEILSPPLCLSSHCYSMVFFESVNKNASYFNLCKNYQRITLAIHVSSGLFIQINERSLTKLAQSLTRKNLGVTKKILYVFKRPVHIHTKLAF